MTVYKTILRFSLLFVVIFFSITDLSAIDTREDKRARKIEKRADRMFIQQGFSEAMDVYNFIIENVGGGLSNSYKVDLNLKMARLYISLQDYPSSIKHFEAVKQLEPNRLSVNDVCSYLDALRYVGDTHKALLISRNYVYEDVYSKSQRYLNILQALTYQHNVGMRPGNEFDVRKLDVNTPNAEYWIGSFKDEFFMLPVKVSFMTLINVFPQD
ncbi:MAG: hypothetical protein LIO65_08540 [Odoribacter sp.]|nr:hypothetical protein [Odoribacter sp.]